MAMHLSTHPTSYPTRYQEIAAKLEQELRQHYRCGDYLPAEQQLAARFEVNRHTLRREPCHARAHVGHAQGQVAQAARLGVRGARWWRGKRKQLQLRAIGQLQVEFVRLALGAVHLMDHGQAQHLSVEVPGTGVVRRNDRYVVQARDLQRPG